MADTEKKPDGGGDAKGGGVKATLMRKVGPLPVVAWVGLASVTLFIVMRMTRGSSSSSDEGTGSYYVTNPASVENSPSDGTGDVAGPPAAVAPAPDFLPILGAIRDLIGELRGGAAANVGAGGQQSSSSSGAAPTGTASQGQSTITVGGVRVPVLDVVSGKVDRSLVRAGDLAREPAGGWTVPPLFQQISPTAVIDNTGRNEPGVVGMVNPDNRLVGYADAAGTIWPDFVKGRTAIWR